MSAMVGAEMKKSSNIEQGISIIEIVCGFAIASIIIILLARIVFSWGHGWTRELARINLQQNMRAAVELISRDFRYQGGSVVYPAIGQAGSYLEFRNFENYRTYRFYTANPTEFSNIATVYRWVKDDNNLVPGVNQLTEPSKVMVKNLTFYREGQYSIHLHLVLADYLTGAETQIETVITCLNKTG